MTCFGPSDRTADAGRRREEAPYRHPEGFPRQGRRPEVAAAVNAAVEFYRAQGCAISEVELPSADLAVPTYYVVATAEASSNLGRY
jgi:aspartyl-tRNA(Asn)/glutamyl-tRNA(Gln) amidotransferase subunit A